MSEWGIGVGDIIKDFNEKLQREREEVKRLRGIIDYIRDTGRMERRYGRLLSIMEKVLTTEEYLEWRRLND